MRWMAYMALVAGLALGVLSPAALCAAPRYLFEQNAASFPDIAKVTSRSFKFLAAVDTGADMESSLLVLRDRVIRAGTEEGYAFKPSGKKKGKGVVKWSYSAKCYYDTPEFALYEAGYVIREVYPYTKDGKPDPDIFSLTVKEMSPRDFERLAKSSLRPAPGVPSKTKFEENVSLDEQGRPQSYFESAVSAGVGRDILGKRTMADFVKLYPALGQGGVAGETPLTPPVTAYSTEARIGGFQLPGGRKMKLTMEGWARSPGGPPILLGIDMDLDGDAGYATPPEAMKAAEDFCGKVFGGALRKYAMPGSEAYMGSKVRILFNRER